MHKDFLIAAVLIFSGSVNILSSATILKQHRRYNRLASMTNYLISVIEEQDIELSEFDIIALKALLNKSGD